MRSRNRHLFWSILLTGAILRIVAGTQSLGFVHPDEHQQYLEAAQKIVYGYGWMYWEYERGIRHYLYPGLLAGTLVTLDALRVQDPVHQAMVIRVLMGLGVLAVMAWAAREWIRDGKPAAGLALIALTAFSPDMIFIGARTLSETAMMIPLVLGVLVWRQRPFWAGILFGLMFAIRFQSAFFTVAFVLCAIDADVIQRRSWKQGTTLPMAFGLGASLIFAGFIDWWTWGSWFHSPIEYVRANIIEGKAASFGVDPWYRYLHWSGEWLLDASVLILPLILLGGYFRPDLAIAVVLFGVGHSMVGHKEPRFLWPAAPLLLMLIATGLEVAWQRLETGQMKRAFASILGIALLIGAGIRATTIDWHCEPTRSTSLALASLHHRADVDGVGVYGVGDAFCGNYFYLRRNVPLAPHHFGPSVFEHPSWLDGTINYLIVPTDDTSYQAYVDLEPVGTEDAFTIARVTQRYGVVPGLGRFVIRNPQDPVQADLLRGRAWEADAIRIFGQYIQAGMGVADIGAYNGVHAVRFARLVGPTGHVYAFEPNPPAHAMLLENIRLNGLQDRITGYACGISDASTQGYVHLSVDPNNLGGTHIVTQPDVAAARLGARPQDLAAEVALVRVDDDPGRWFPRPVGFVKIDVEGHEDRVIAGCETWLREHRPVLYVEIWDDAKRSQEKLPFTNAEMIAMIERLGYEMIEKVGEWDCLFVPKDSDHGDMEGAGQLNPCGLHISVSPL
jgi:FkbM family methyltransferase